MKIYTVKPKIGFLIVEFTERCKVKLEELRIAIVKNVLRCNTYKINCSDSPI